MQVFETPVGKYVGFTEEEEASIAETVFTMLSHRGFRGEDADYVNYLFWKIHCRYGNPLHIEEVDRFLVILGDWQERDYFPIPFPKLVFNDIAMFETSYDKVKTEVVRIWHDVWLEFKDRLAYISDDYLTFPGLSLLRDVMIIKNQQHHFDKAAKAEKAFWAEVERANRVDKLSLSDSYLYALDTHPRGRDRIPMVLLTEWLMIEHRHCPARRFHPPAEHDHRLVRRESE